MQLAAGMSRLGTESAFEVLARAQALAATGKPIINLGIGQPDFRTPEHIVEAGIKALRDGHHGYTPANGLPALRAAVAMDLNRRHGVEVEPGPCGGGARRQADDVLRGSDVRRSGGRDHVSEPRLPDLRSR